MGLKINKPAAATPTPETVKEAAVEATKPKVGLKLSKKPPAGTATEVKQAEATVTKVETHKGQETAPPETTKELVGEAVLTAAAQPWCEITVDASFTKNLGDYNSTRIGVSLKMPSLPEEIEDAFKVTRAWVDEKLTEMVDGLN